MPENCLQKLQETLLKRVQAVLELYYLVTPNINLLNYTLMF